MVKLRLFKIYVIMCHHYFFFKDQLGVEYADTSCHWRIGLYRSPLLSRYDGDRVDHNRFKSQYSVGKEGLTN